MAVEQGLAVNQLSPNIRRNMVSAPSIADWSERDLSFIGPHAAEAGPTRAICKAVLHAEPPEADLPGETERESLRGCDSWSLYFGIDGPADPVAARKCALMERGTVSLPAEYGGETVLAMVYANGNGADRDLDVAIHMACGMNDAPAAMEYRIAHLAELRDHPDPSADFSYCDDFTSGGSEAVCASLDEHFSERRRQQRVSGLSTRWDEATREKFDAAYAAFAEYADRLHEMDCFRGTAQSACEVRGRNAEQTAFLDRVEAVVAKKEAPRALPERPLGNPATQPDEWAQSVAYLTEGDPDLRAWYDENRDHVAARARFERQLIAFFAAGYPQYSAHRIRQLFGDL